MAETIKGISVLIEGDTTGLSKALSNVNKESRDIQSELRQVEKLLKLDPSNTELLTQKQTLLANAVSNAKEKLDSLKLAQEQVNEQFARGDISEGQYRAFQREIAASEQSLIRLEGQLSATGQESTSLGETMEASGNKIKEVGEKVKGAGEKMSVGISAPIVAAGGLMLKGAIDAETAQSKLQASLGITAEEAGELGDVATEVWKNGFGENIEEVDAAIIEVKKNMAGLKEGELKTVTEGAMTLADVFGADVVDSSKTAGTMMKNFGISGTDALDLLTVGFQKGGDYSGELLDTMNEYSPQFASMGLTADQAMGMLIAGAEAGSFSLDKVGDAMKEFNIRSQDGSKATSAGFKAIGLDADKMGAAMAKGGEDGQKAFTATVTGLAAMKDPIAQNAAGTALFGTQWEDVRSKVIVAMADGVKGVGDFKGANDAASKAMYDNNPMAALTVAIRGVQAAIGPALLPLADIIKNTVVPAIKSLSDWFTNLSPEGQKTALAIAGIVAAIGPLLLILGPIISVIGGVVAGVGAISLAMAGGATGIAILTTAFPALGAAFAVITGPIGIAIAVIAGLVAIGVLLYKNWDTIKATGAVLGQWLTNFFTVDIPTAITTAITWVSQLPEKIGEFFGQIPGIVSNFLGGAITKITEFGSNIITWVTTEIPKFVSSFMTFIDELPGKIGDALGFALGTIIKFGVDAVNWVVTEVPKFISGIITFYAELPGKIGTELSNALTTLVTWASNMVTTASTEVPKIITRVVNFFAELPGKIGTQLSNALTSLKTWVSNMLTTVSTEVPKIVSSIVSFFSELPGKIFDVGTNIVRGLWDGMNSMVTWLGDKVREFAQGILQGMKRALDIKSPSQVMRDEVGVMIGAGVAEGIGDSVQQVKSAMGKLNSEIHVGGTTGGVKAIGSSNSASQSSTLGNFNQYITIQSPTALSPSETARQVKNASRRLALEL